MSREIIGIIYMHMWIQREALQHWLTVNIVYESVGMKWWVKFSLKYSKQNPEEHFAEIWDSSDKIFHIFYLLFGPVN